MTTATRPRRSERGPAGWSRRWLWGGVALAVLAAALVTLWLVLSDPSPPEPDPDGEGCNGQVELCDRTLDQVALAGSHNAMAVQGAPGWHLGEQRRSITDQLEDGVRALLLDVYPGYEHTDSGDDGDGGTLVRTDLRQPLTAAASRADVTPAGQRILRRLGVTVGAVPPEDADIRPYLCHAYCELGATDFVDQLRDIRDFLTDNPDDVLLMVLQDYVTGADTERAFRDAGLFERVWPLAPGEQLPTLREMVTSRRTVVVLSENHGGEVAWLPSAFDLMEETPFEFPSPSDFTCAPNRGGTDKPFFLLNHWLDYKGRPTVTKARPVNGRASIEQRLDQCRAERGRLPDIVAVDFTDTSAVVRVVAALNREPGGLS